MTSETPIDIRPVSMGDLSGMMSLLAETRPAIGRMSTDSSYRALMVESMKRRGLWWLVAVEEGTVIGFVVAHRRGRSFWRHFLLRHPALLLRLAADQTVQYFRHTLWYRKSKRAGSSAALAPADSEQSGPRWSDDDPSVAKGVFIAVATQLRGRGVGGKLCDALVQTLAREGIARLDVHIDLDNDASVQMVQRVGWAVHREPSGYLGTVDLLGKRN
jgi:ribosomal protein S18 acetylase RimI-like enzyme